MIRHTERIRKVEAVRMVAEADYFIFEVDVTTAGNVRKTLRLPHIQADMLRNGIEGELDTLEREERGRSFIASAKAFR